MRTLALVAALVLAPIAARAECISETNEIHGKVTTASGVPVAGATVTFVWNAYPKPKTATATTDSHGRFRAEFQFNLLSGESSYGDICEGKLAHISAEAASTKGSSNSRVIPATDLNKEIRLVVKEA